MHTKYDLVFKGGRVVDPVQNIDGRFDLAVEGGRVAELAPDIDPGLARGC